MIAELADDNSVAKAYTFGNDLISQTDLSTSNTSYFHYDGQGNTRNLSDTNGLSDSYTFDAFGTLLNTDGITDNDYLYSGEQFDAQLDNYYLRARYYDQNVGRFTQFDSFEGLDLYPASLHKYVYVANDPLTYTDPSGYTFLTNQLIASTIRGQLARTSASRVGISIARSKSTKQLVWDGGCFVIEDIVIREATRIATEGVYLFSDLNNNGQPYTGQAKNVKNRTNQHAKAGRVKADAFLRSFPVTVRDKGKIKDALDILEQWVLEVLLEEAGYDKSGKIKNAPVGNQKNVIGKNRPKLQKALSKAKLCG